MTTAEKIKAKMDEQMDFIRTKCIAVNPEIAKLKFGCEVTLHGETCVYLGYSHDRAMLGEECHNILKPDGVCYSCKSEKEFVVIGRPIDLSDILFVLHIIPERPPSVGFDEHIEAHVKRMKEKTWRVIENWGFVKHYLHAQKAETIEVIYALYQ